MTVVWILVALVGALLWVESRSWRLGVWVTKPLASAAFVVLALQLDALKSHYGTWILVGLIACCLGDILLIPHHRGSFKAGILSFLVGHLLYSVAFLVHGISPFWALSGGILLSGPAWLVGRWLLERVEPGLRAPVFAYILVISGMLALAIGASARDGKMVFLMAAGGFYLSDLAVARNRFLHPGFVNRLVGLPLYYSAQVLFAWTVKLV